MVHHSLRILKESAINLALHQSLPVTKPITKLIKKTKVYNNSQDEPASIGFNNCKTSPCKNNRTQFPDLRNLIFKG